MTKRIIPSSECAFDSELIEAVDKVEKEWEKKKKQRTLEPTSKNIAFLMATRPFSSGDILQKVISGGQTGADKAGLEAAFRIGISTGGWAPANFITSAGPDLSLKTKFGLQELALPNDRNLRTSLVQTYVSRSKKNVDISCGTIAFRLIPSVGTDKTIHYCITHKWGRKQWWDLRDSRSQYRPCLIITNVSDEVHSETVSDIVHFITDQRLRTVNIAGHRDNSSRQENFSKMVETILFHAFEAISGK